MHKLTRRLTNILLSILCSIFFSTPSVLAQDDISGEWKINSSVGGEIPISVNCTLNHQETVLSGACIPVMENAQSSDIAGKVLDGKASWGYDVVFNGNPGRVEFEADVVEIDFISGTLSLSGTLAPFEAHRQK